MSTRDDHLRFLCRGDFRVPATVPGLTPDERQLLVKCGYWLEALANGQLSPISADQVHFILVTKGQVVPRNMHEYAWIKLRPPPKLRRGAPSKRSPAELTVEDEAVLRQLRGMITRHEVVSSFANSIIEQWQTSGRLTSKQLASARQFVARVAGRASLPRTVGGGGRKPGSHRSNW